MFSVWGVCVCVLCVCVCGVSGVRLWCEFFMCFCYMCVLVL